MHNQNHGLKQDIIAELDSRIQRLHTHLEQPIEPSDNQYDQLNQALSKTIGTALEKELESVREFVSGI